MMDLLESHIIWTTQQIATISLFQPFFILLLEL